MLEITLTRVFSVTMWYHFAFLAVSLAVFGIGVSGQAVYLFPSRFSIEKLSTYSFLCAVSMVPVLIVSLYVSLPLGISYESIPILGVVYITCSIPFFFGGLCIALLFSQYSSRAAHIYLADLLGAGIGCFAVVFVLNEVGGPPALLVISLCCITATVFFSVKPSKKLCTFFVLFFMGVGSILYQNDKTPFLDVRMAKGVPQDHILHAEWNAISRVSVFQLGAPFRGWALSSTWEGDVADNMGIDIDANAFSPIVKFSDDLKECLKYDIPALPYYLNHGTVLLIGTGGGRDIVTALLFDCDVTAVEINPTVIAVTNDMYGDYSGHIYDSVALHIEDGRSFIEHSSEKYDIIQMSLVDTWAASSSGAYALSETYLYTTEAFIEYFEHLEDNGILSVTRWIFETPQQTLRLVSLGREALKRSGVSDAAAHMMILKNGPAATFLLKKTPFTEKEIQSMENTCNNLQFEIVYTPKTRNNPVFTRLITTDNPETFFEAYPLNVSPTTDDKPFFFYTVTLSDLPDLVSLNLESESFKNNIALLWLFRLIILSFLLVVLFLLLPPLIFAKRASVKAMSYFAFLGLGFMFVEIPLLQKFMLVLGHPTYSLSVVLFSLLVSGGIGSYLTNHLSLKKVQVVMAYLMGAILFYIILFPALSHELFSLTIFKRIVISVFMASLVGVAMGMPFPSGIMALGRTSSHSIPWAWAINGAASVLGSALAVFVGINLGFSYAFICGVVFYGAACFFMTFLK
jgi:hypothetical protein